jgi:tetratricopeptide (TPR) repeat protein
MRAARARSFARRFGPLVLAVLLMPAFSSVASAAKKKKKPAGDASASASVEPSAAPIHDAAPMPSARKGLSAFDTQLIDAHKSFIAGSAGGAIDDAIAQYRKAIAADPARPEGHLYLGAALFAKGDYAGADEALNGAISRARADASLAALLGKSLFLRAVELEAASRAEDAKTAWQAYAEFAKEHPDQPAPKGFPESSPVVMAVYPGSATERVTKIELNQKLREDYAKVRALIEKRQKELGETPAK